MNKNIYIPIHSFVDLITNSSSEVFVNDTEKTVEALKEAVNAILKLAKSDKTCDDLFDAQLCYPAECDITNVIERFQDDIPNFSFKNTYTDQEFIDIVKDKTSYVEGALEVYKSVDKENRWGYYLNKDIFKESEAALFIESLIEYESRPIQTLAALIPKSDSPELKAVAQALHKITGTVDAQTYYS